MGHRPWVGKQGPLCCLSWPQHQGWQLCFKNTCPLDMAVHPWKPPGQYISYLPHAVDELEMFGELLAGL